MTLTEAIGWTGAIALATCSLPQILKTWKTKSTKDLAWSFITLWAIGEYLTWIYLIIHNIQNQDLQLPLHLNYLLNSIGITYLLIAKHKYK